MVKISMKGLPGTKVVSARVTEAVFEQIDTARGSIGRSVWLVQAIHHELERHAQIEREAGPVTYGHRWGHEVARTPRQIDGQKVLCARYACVDCEAISDWLPVGAQLADSAIIHAAPPVPVKQYDHAGPKRRGSR